MVRRGGEEVHCTRTEFRLLCELADHPGKVLSREHLLERVWGYDYFGDGRLVDVHVRRLRTKIEPEPGRPAVHPHGPGHGLQAGGLSVARSDHEAAEPPAVRQRQPPPPTPTDATTDPFVSGSGCGPGSPPPSPSAPSPSPP